MENHSQKEGYAAWNDFGDQSHVNQEAIETLLATKAGGLITRKMVELGERQLIENAKHGQ